MPRKKRTKPPEPVEAVEPVEATEPEPELESEPVETEVVDKFASLMLEGDSLGFEERSATDCIAWHCSATPADSDIGFAEIDAIHKDKGYGNAQMACGYHFIIRRNGDIEVGRPIQVCGEHVMGHDDHTIGVLVVGGTSDVGVPVANYSDTQLRSMYDLAVALEEKYFGVEHKGHRDFISPDPLSETGLPECPCFVAAEKIESLKGIFG
jgi:hypothetical protein